MFKSIYTKDQQVFQTLLKKLRTEKELRQIDLANSLKVPQSFISKVEAGERRLDILELRKICAVLGISLIDFVQKLEDELNEA